MSNNRRSVAFILLLSVITITVIIVGTILNEQKKQELIKEAEYLSSLNDIQKTFSNDKIFVHVLKNKIKVYVKGSNEGSNKYIGYHLTYAKKELDKSIPNSNYEIWGLDGADEYARVDKESFRLLKEVVTEGEWELALYEDGANDFVGGRAHGDEILTSTQIFIDGKEIELGASVEQEASELKLTTTSDLYRDNTITDNPEIIGEHIKTYTFSKDGLVLNQDVTFHEDITLTTPFLTMLPISRENKYGQITDTYMIGDNKKEYDISEEGFQEQYFKTNKVTIFGEESGISATVEITEKSDDKESIFHVSNLPKYNKLYFAFAEQNQRVSANQTWSQETFYKIDTVN